MPHLSCGLSAHTCRRRSSPPRRVRSLGPVTSRISWRECLHDKHMAYLPDKSDESTIAAFDEHRVKVETQTGRKIKRVRTDNAFNSDICTLLDESGLPERYWAAAGACSTYTRNLMPSRRHPGKIPQESFDGQRVDVSHLRVFGSKCGAKVNIVNGHRVDGGSKLGSRTIPATFIGYGTGAGNCSPHFGCGGERSRRRTTCGLGSIQQCSERGSRGFR
ncbi:hypothetical protein B0H16DRAFT_1541031 [Mycena metata]|uniref:Uncharacterized protein n=1 Tax=Mycena metata TaxID=1033252 RepID=A0AAD7J2I0_9AGAR|nr:hypothetical protein B0H16DRAFT_1541031 [Mycena metata]